MRSSSSGATSSAASAASSSRSSPSRAARRRPSRRSKAPAPSEPPGNLKDSYRPTSGRLTPERELTPRLVGNRYRFKLLQVVDDPDFPILAIERALDSWTDVRTPTIISFRTDMHINKLILFIDSLVPQKYRVYLNGDSFVVRAPRPPARRQRGRRGAKSGDLAPHVDSPRKKRPSAAARVHLAPARQGRARLQFWNHPPPFSLRKATWCSRSPSWCPSRRSAQPPRQHPLALRRPRSAHVRLLCRRCAWTRRRSLAPRRPPELQSNRAAQMAGMLRNMADLLTSQEQVQIHILGAPERQR